MLIRLAWRNIWRNRLRTSITLIGVLLAVVLSTLMTSAKEGMYTNMINSLVSDFTGYAQLHTKDYVDAQVLDNSLVLNDTLLSYLESNSSLEGYTTRIAYGSLVYKDTIPAIVSKRAMVFGLNMEKEKGFIGLNERVSEGEYLLNDDHAVLVGDGLAKKLKITIGDSIIMSGVGYQEMGAHGLYNVKGIVKFGSPELSNNLIILPFAEAQYMYNLENRCTDVILYPKDKDNVEHLVDKINEDLGGKYAARDWKELNEELLKMIETDRVEGYVFMIILYMVITFGLFGTMLMMLSERKREFGVLISIGMKRLKLARIVWIELVSISFLGAFIGMLFSFPICYYFYSNPIRFGGDEASMIEEYGIEPVIQFSIDPGIFIQQGIIVFIISTIIAMYPFWKLIRLNTQNAMRS